jgi:DNA-damage-inducible protein D
MLDTTPDFERIKKMTEFGAEYWSARELQPLLGYSSSWQSFETAIRRAKTACKQIGQTVENHFTDTAKTLTNKSGTERQVKDYFLSRFACYLIAQNGDPAKPEIAGAQAYFAFATRENELHELYEMQQDRAKLRERIALNTQVLAETAYAAGVLPKNWGIFENAGMEGLYGGLDIKEIKQYKGVDAKEDLFDRMGREELASNDFRITQTSAKLRRDHTIGQDAVIQTHRLVGEVIRDTITEIGGTMPEELPPEPSIRPLVNQRKRSSKNLPKKQSQTDS